MPNRVPLKYRQMKADAASPVDVYVAAFTDDVNAEYIVSLLFDIEKGSEPLKAIADEAMRNLFKDYLLLREEGTSADAVAAIARENGLTGMKRTQMIRFVFDCSFVDMKEAIVRGDELASSLDQYQERFADALEAAFKEMEADD